MFTLLVSLLFSVPACFRTRAALQAEILALRHQLLVLQRSSRGHKLRLSSADRVLWVWLSHLWTEWRSALIVVKPGTVIGWHRQGFRLYWRWKSRHGEGRPLVSSEIRDLIRRMSLANPRWGAPCIHGELMKLGIHVSQATVAKYMVRHRKPPSQTWRTFLKNHMQDLVSQLLEAFPWDSAPRYLLRDRDGIYGEKVHEATEWLGLREVLTAPKSPWQNPYVERLIGSIRHECLDHVITFDETGLHRVLKSYFESYNYASYCPPRYVVENSKPFCCDVGIVACRLLRRTRSTNLAVASVSNAC